MPLFPGCCKYLYSMKIKIPDSPDNYCQQAGPRSTIGRAPDSQVRGPGFDTRSGNILSFLRFFKKGSCQLLAKVCARSTG